MVRGLIWYFCPFHRRMFPIDIFFFGWIDRLKPLARWWVTLVYKSTHRACSMYNCLHSQSHTNLQNDKQQFTHFQHYLENFTFVFFFGLPYLAATKWDDLRWSSKMQVDILDWPRMGLGCQESPRQKNPTDPLYNSYKFFSAVFPGLILELPQILPQKLGNLGTFWIFLVRVGARNTGIWDTKKIQHLGWTVGAWDYVVLSSGCRISHSMTRVCHSMRLGAQTQQPSIVAFRMARNPLNGFAAILTSKTLFAVTNLQVGICVAEDLKDGKKYSADPPVEGLSSLIWQKNILAYWGNGPTHHKLDGQVWGEYLIKLYPSSCWFLCPFC